MHICFLPVEVLLDIFASIDPDRPGFDTNISTVAVLARTCRKFKEPALDTLWKHVPGFKPLILCLPRGVRGQIVSKEGLKKSRKLTLKRPLFAEEWNVFNSYACRIRSLTIRPLHLNEIDDRVVTVLISALPLPNLHKLKWEDNRDIFLPLLNALLAPTIKSMVLGPVWEPSFTKYALLVSLGARCPHIQEFTCRYNSDSGEQSDALLEAVRCWSELNRFDAGVLDSRTLAYLAPLPLLRSLRFVSFDGTRPKSIPTFTSKVDNVYIAASSLPVLTRCLENVRFVFCRSVVLDVTSIDPDPLVVKNFILSLSESFPSVLEQIIFEYHYDLETLSAAESADPHFALGFDAIAPLLLFSHLTVVDLPWISSSAIDDAMVQKMAQSWPLLEGFYLGTLAGSLIPPSITFTGLVHLIRHCRHLRDISMVFHACSIYRNSEPFSDTIPNEKIIAIYVGNSPIDDPITVACQLHILLPNLHSAEYESAPGVPLSFEREWDRVEDFLAVQIEGRSMKQERAQAQAAAKEPMLLV